ncbi:MAG: DUF5716 family protein [Erysipelotrichaceae bacterium]|nr:DUF5716 family protein [Solobacterium sp.]MDY2731003.1 DUF5716 family protein [Erysipelotrichaceae bacterium]MDY4641042.1 DUF5716 family protein [Erysipelotrichaceae bacterium]MDY5653181.1 DUF5716 family protein [Erysipelotrichaceae bacterium]
MDVFEILKNEKFFNPLTGVNKRVYFECISELIEYSKTTPVLYETNVRDTLELYLSNKQYHVENDDTEFGYDDRDSVKIIRKFRECGWLSKPELGRNGEYITNITSNCRRIIDYLNRICNRRNDASISNRILSMYEILQGTYSENSVRKERPYSLVIVPLMDDETELKNEVLDLKDSISIIFGQVTEINEFSAMGSYILDNKFLEKFFTDYFYMKTNGLIPSILKGISDQLRRFKNDSLMDKAIDEYSKIMQINHDKAKDILTKIVDEMFYYITNEYPESMESIDENINKYYRLLNMRTRFLTSNGLNIQSTIDTILTRIKESQNEEKAEIIDKLQECVSITSQRYISRKSYQKKKRQVFDTTSSEIVVDDLTDEEKAAITNELMENSINPYSIERTNSYFNVLFKENMMPFVKSKYIRTKEEALMFASAFIYSGENEFDYVVELEEGYEATAVADITNMIVRRKD